MFWDHSHLGEFVKEGSPHFVRGVDAYLLGGRRGGRKGLDALTIPFSGRGKFTRSASAPGKRLPDASDAG